MRIAVCRRLPRIEQCGTRTTQSVGGQRRQTVETFGAGLTVRIVRSRIGHFIWELSSAMNVRTNKAQVHASRARRGALAGCVSLLLALPAHAGPNEQARRIYERIAGVPPTAAVLTSMANAITAQPGQAGLLAAAAIATQAPTFYNVTVKNMVIPWTNRNQTVFAPLNA